MAEWVKKTTARTLHETSLGESTTSALPPNSDVFSIENILNVLRRYNHGLEAREVCLLCQGKDPKLNKAESADIKTVKKILYTRADVGVKDPNDPKPKFYLIRA